MLSEKYREYQSEVHPDRFANSDENEKLIAVQRSSLLNEAYSTLKSPLKRAGYLLVLKQKDIEKVDQSDLGMDLLLEQIELREALDQLPNDESSLSELERLKSEVKDKLNNSHQSFTLKFDKEDFDGAKKIYHELQFLYKLLAEIELGEEKRLGY